MTPLHESLVHAMRAIDALGSGTALIGGLAVSVWCDPRFTRDVDLVVAADTDEIAEALIHRLRQDGYRLLATVEQKAVDRLATVRLVPPRSTD